MTNETNNDIEEVVIVRQIPKIARTQSDRNKVALQLSTLVQQAITAKGSLPEIWLRTESYQRNDPPAYDTAPDEGMSPLHIPFLQPRIDTLVGQICSVVARQHPLMLAVSGLGDELSTRLEAIVHRQWESGGFDRACRGVALNAALHNKGVWRLAFEFQPGGILPEGSDQIEDIQHGPVRFAGIKIDSIHPNDFVIAPSAVDGIQSAMLVGHRFYARLAYIKERQRLGEYFDNRDYELVGGDSPEAHDDMMSIVSALTSPSVFSGFPETELVELFELYVKLPDERGLERYYRAVLAPYQNYLLDLQAWPYSRPPYFTSELLTDEYFWSGKSVGRNLSPLQDLYDKLNALVYNGSYMASAPPIFGPRLDNEKYSQYKPYSYLETEGGGGQPFQATTQFNAQPLLQQIAACERNGDMVARVSTNSLGAEEAKSSLTATQTQAIQQGMSVGLQEYIAMFTLSFGQMAAFTCEVLADQYIVWRLLYPEQKVSQDDLKRAVSWEPNGKTPADAPMARLATLQQLWAMGQNPASQFDLYEIAKLSLACAGIPGADKIQRERPAPTPQGMPNDPRSMGAMAPNHPGMAGNQMPSLPPQVTQQGVHLPPIAESSVRPSTIGNPEAGGGEQALGRVA